MPLQFSPFSVSFSQGVDTKSDRKQVIPGKLLSLENGVFRETGAINKRYGYDALSLEIDGGDAIPSGDALATYRDELLLFGGGRVFSRLESTSKWVDRGQAISIINGTRAVISNGSEQTEPDVGFSNGLEVYAWNDTRGGIRYSVIDRATGAFIITDGVVSPWASNPKVIPVGQFILIFFGDIGALKYRAINVASPRQLAPEIAYSLTLNPGGVFDVISVADGYGVTSAFTAWDNGTDISVSTLSSNLVPGSVSSVADSVNKLGLFTNADGNLWIAYHNGSAVMATLLSSSGLGPLLAPTLVEVFVTDAEVQQLIHITGIETSTGIARIWYEVSKDENPPPVRVIRHCTINNIGAVGVPSDFARSVGLASKPFKVNGVSYVNTTYQSTFQSTYFTLDQNSNIVSKAIAQVGGGYRGETISSVPQPELGVFLYAASKKGRLISEDDSNTGTGTRQLNRSGLFSLLGACSVSLDFANPNQFQTAELGNNLYVIGGVVQTYDGVSFTEANFHLYPDSDLISTSRARINVGGMPQGQYQYQVIYEDTDNSGQIIRSTPSEIITVNISPDDDGYYIVTLTGPMLRLTARKSPRSNCRIVIYRTEANGSTFYRLTSIVAPLFNDPTIDRWTFADTLTDGEIISRERIYTDGGVLDAGAPPAATLIHTYRNRIFLSGLEDPEQLWYSQTVIPGEVVNFSPFLLSIADRRGGKIGALGELDSALVVFKESAIFYISGQGPDALGGGTFFDDPQLVTTDVGCSNPNSVALTSQGLVFQSAKGIMLLPRGLSNVVYIGAPVERYNGLKITSSTVIPDQNLVLFTTESDIALVWDYYANQWSTFTNHEAVDSLIWGSTFTMLRPNGSALLQSKSVFTDDGALVRLSLTTSFLSLAGLMGSMRVRRLGLLGELKGEHTLSVAISYDFNPNPIGLYSVIPTDVINYDLWGSGATWGSDPTFGGDYVPYFFVIQPLARQVCTSIAFTISDEQSSGYNEGFSISGLTLEIGTKQGLSRIRRGALS